MSIQPAYLVTAGVPISSGPGFLTPLFASEQSNSLFYQDIRDMQEVVGFRPAPEEAADRAIGINSSLERRIGDHPYYAFRDLSGNISVETMDRLAPVLRNEFKELHAHPHLQKSIATALKDDRLLDIAIEALRRHVSTPPRAKSFDWNARSEALVGRVGTAPVLFPSPARALEKLSSHRSNFLLSGARGTGKTLVLKLLQQRLEAAGLQTLWVDARASHVPLAVSLALSHARESGNYANLRAKAHMHSHTKHRLQEHDLKELRQSLHEVAEQLMAGEVTVLIDDIHLFADGIDWPQEFQNTVLLSELFRLSPSSIVASTTHGLGSANLFGRTSAHTPLPGQDYQIIALTEAAHQDHLVAKKLISEVMASRVPHVMDLKPDIDALAEYASAENPRRVLTLLSILERSSGFSAPAVKEAHNKYMKQTVSNLEMFEEKIGADEYARQIRTIVEALKKALRQRDRKMEQLGRSQPAGMSSFFRISPADDIAVLGWAIDLGLLLLRYNNEMEKGITIRFHTSHDEEWFIKHYDRFGAQSASEGAGEQNSLF